jgi:hypothetical protein
MLALPSVTNVSLNSGSSGLKSWSGRDIVELLFESMRRIGGDLMEKSWLFEGFAEREDEGRWESVILGGRGKSVSFGGAGKRLMRGEETRKGESMIGGDRALDRMLSEIRPAGVGTVTTVVTIELGVVGLGEVPRRAGWISSGTDRGGGNGERITGWADSMPGMLCS